MKKQNATLRYFRRALLIFLIAQPATARAQENGLPRARPEDVGLSVGALQRIVPAMRVYVDSARLAGIAMAIVRDGKLAYLETVGTMDPQRTVPMRADAVFRIYSMTKPITSTAIMQLYERGRLKLDDPVSKYIPAFANMKVYAGGPSSNPTLKPADREITIADLLTHTAGLTYGAFGNTPVDSIYRRASLLNPNQTIAQFADSIAKLPLLRSPGEAWVYSMAIDVLGRVVEVASGKTFDRYLDDEIFKPLGMRMTAFHETPAMQGHITAVFSTTPRGLQTGAQLLGAGYRAEGKVFAGGQGLLSTIPDYLRFAQMLLNGGELDGKRVLKRETVAMMMKNQLPPTLSVNLVRGYGFGYGGAVQVDSGPTLPAPPSTFRWSGYASTYFWIDPRNKLIGMVWAQHIPQLNRVEQDFQRLVYAAITGR